MHISSNMLPQRAAYFSDGPTRNHRSWPTPRPRRAVCALLKTRNRLAVNPDKFCDELRDMRNLFENVRDRVDSILDDKIMQLNISEEELERLMQQLLEKLEQDEDSNET
jgi:hypothetical protein